MSERMQSWNRAMVKYGKWYLLSSFLTKGTSFILMPIYTRYLTQHDYGILQSINSIISFLPILISLCLDSAYVRFFHDCKSEKNKISTLFSTIYWSILLFGGLIIALILLSSLIWFEDLLYIPVFPYAFLAFIPTLFSQLSLLCKSHLEQSLLTSKITILDVTSTLVNGGVSLILLIIFKLGIISRLIGTFIAALYLLVFYYYYNRKEGLLTFTFDKSILISCLKYSIPLMPAMLGSLISAASDRLVIAEYVNMETVALYSFAFQIASLVYVAGDAITRTMTPLAMSGLVNNKEETKIKIADFSVIIWSVMILVNLIIFLFSKEIVKIMGSDAYEQAYILIPFLGFVYVLGMQQRFPNQIIQFYKKSWIISAGCIIMGGANLLLNLIFVPHWGYVAAVVNTILSNAIYVLWTFIQASRLEKINYKWRKLLLISIVFIALLFLEYIIVSSMEVTILNFFLKTTIAFAVCCLVILSTDIHIFNKILNYIRK